MSPRVAIGFTGNRIGYDSGQPILGSGRRKTTIGFWLQYLQLKLGQLEGHHGDCEGSDAAFHKQCLRARIPRVIHPPDKGGARAMIHQVDQFEPEFSPENWTKILPAKPYLDRNQDIVDISKVLLAAPSDFVEEQRSGTWATIRRARAAKLWTILVYPDGTWADDRPEFRPEWCKVPDHCWCELGVHTQCQMCFNRMPYCSCNFCNWPDEYDHRWDGDQCLMCGFDATDAQAVRLAGQELPNCNTMRA